MKKLLLAGVVLLAAVSAYGQGRVAFANTSGTLVTTNNFSGGSGPISGLDNFYIALYVGNPGLTSNQLVLAGLTTNAAAAGRFTGGNPFTIPTINGVNYGDGRPLSYQLRGWSRAGNNFTDFESALGGASFMFLGESEIRTVTPTFIPTGAAALFGGAPGTLTSGFALYAPIPEPSSIALALLGLFAFFRRRRK